MLLGEAVGGLHTMVDEHFGIGIVQYMAAGVPQLGGTTQYGLVTACLQTPICARLPLLTAMAERATAMRQLLSLARDSRRLHTCKIDGTVAACQQHNANAPVLDTMFVQQPSLHVLTVQGLCRL